MTDGAVQTRLMPQGQDVHVGESPLLFYAVGRDQLLSVPAEAAASFVEECRLMEMVVEEYQDALAELSVANSNYMALMMSARRDHRFLLDKEVLQGEIVAAQRKVEHKNQVLKNVIEPLTELSSETNKVMELIPIRRGGSRTEHFRLAYARSHIIRAFAEEIPLASGGANASESVLTGGRVDSDKLIRQMTDVRGQAKIKADFPWFEEWLKKDKETLDLFKWSEAINRNLSAKHEIVEGEEHHRDSYRVELSAEAQLMRWTSGASGLSGEFNPFTGKATLKADAKAELVLAEAKATLDYCTPAGGLMLACELPGQQTLDLGMIRSRTLMTIAGGVGASIAAELNLNVEMRQGKLQANGVQGELVRFGLPGEQRVILRENDNGSPDNTEAATGMAAFAGGQLEAIVGVQLEWKNPEEGHKFKPFAKTATGGAALAGIGGGANFGVRYENGKFRISAKVGFCFGFGAKGKVDFEVDASLLLEFVKWVAYQLKNIDYRRLFFIENDAFYAITGIVTMAAIDGKRLSTHLREDVSDIIDDLNRMFHVVNENIKSAAERGDLAERINSGEGIIKYATPDAKGVTIYWLMQTNTFDRFYPGNRDLEGWWEDPSIFGFMNDRKEAIMNVLRLVQSINEYRNVMQRVVPRVGETINWEDGEQIVEEFLGRGEQELPRPFSSHYAREFIHLRARLWEKSRVGMPIVRNDRQEYRSQRSISSYFSRACENSSQCIVKVQS
ncbi:hypothetical protein [Halomonas sp. DN3]|uniref:hypothetical protein n=1 Tax=Halomonas sp. DN3 TaxID=2953657 RepID=UPI00209E4D70|nr:hypothetical protein [Halomonas sp. DN3]USZ50113.1 hypothetical protein NKF27_00885 [Halomonas sp. DN3]